ncbi:MAG: hypothetical protein FWH23_00075 [Bacteroidales bacterium]|nr:hypothetical protein [Bacteroidales bacterium]
MDTLLMETIVPPVKGYNHQHSCNKVLSTMKNKLNNEFAIGIIDDDKVVPKDLNDFEYVKTYHKTIKLYKHRSRPHYVIKIVPAVEQFILNDANRSAISLATYNLPSDVKLFTKITKHNTSKNHKDLKNLLTALKQNNSQGIFQLTQLVEHLKANPYNPQFDLL